MASAWHNGRSPWNRLCRIADRMFQVSRQFGIRPAGILAGRMARLEKMGQRIGRPPAGGGRAFGQG